MSYFKFNNGGGSQLIYLLFSIEFVRYKLLLVGILNKCFFFIVCLCVVYYSVTCMTYVLCITVYIWCVCICVCVLCVLCVCMLARTCVIVVNIVPVGASVPLAGRKVQPSRQLGSLTVGSALHCWLSGYADCQSIYIYYYLAYSCTITVPSFFLLAYVNKRKMLNSDMWKWCCNSNAIAIQWTYSWGNGGMRFEFFYVGIINNSSRN